MSVPTADKINTNPYAQNVNNINPSTPKTSGQTNYLINIVGVNSTVPSHTSVHGHEAKTSLGHICSGSCNHGPKVESKQIHVEVKQTTVAKPANNPYANTTTLKPTSHQVLGHDAKAALGHICNGSCNHGPKQTNSHTSHSTQSHSSVSRFASSLNFLTSQNQTATTPKNSSQLSNSQSLSNNNQAKPVISSSAQQLNQTTQAKGAVTPTVITANKAVPSGNTTTPTKGNITPMTAQTTRSSNLQSNPGTRLGTQTVIQSNQAKATITSTNQATTLTTTQSKVAASSKGFGQVAPAGSQSPASPNSSSAVSLAQHIPAHATQTKGISAQGMTVNSQTTPTTQGTTSSTQSAQALVTAKGSAPTGATNSQTANLTQAITATQAGKTAQVVQSKGGATAHMMGMSALGLAAKIPGMTQDTSSINRFAHSGIAPKGTTVVPSQAQTQGVLGNKIAANSMSLTQIHQQLTKINNEILMIQHLLVGQGIQASQQALNHMVASQSLLDNAFAALFAGSLMKKQKKEDLIRSLKQLLKKKKELLDQVSDGEEIDEDPFNNESFMIEWFTENEAYL